MSRSKITVEVPAEVKQKIVERAARDGTSAAQVVRELVLRSRLWKRPDRKSCTRDAPGQRKLFDDVGRSE